MPRLRGLSRNQLTILTIGCAETTEGPSIAMPDGSHYKIKASDVVWMARRIKQLETGSSSLEEVSPAPEPPEQETANDGEA